MPHKDAEKRRALCRTCRQRFTAKEKRYNDTTQGRKNHRRQWTEQEIALLWDINYTTKELAEFLSRTFYAIIGARKRLAARQPKETR